MLRLSSVLAVVCALGPASLFAQDPPPAPPAQQAPIVRELRISGTKELTTRAVIDALSVQVGELLPANLGQVSERVEHVYREEGYTFARAKTDFDASSGALSIAIDEGVIDAVEFDGVDARLADTFAKDFALRAGDVFHIRRARQALDALLGPTRGAVTPARITFSDPSKIFHDTRELRERRGTFDLIDRDGQRVLRVGLREPAGRFKVSPNLGNREDWFTPVDGFVPALDVGAVAFEHGRFNHTFVAGHVSVKTASGNVGYALGVERPLFGARKLFLSAEVHDLTATDDAWQVSSSEASLAAIGPRLSYRDYYRRRGVQMSAAYRVEPRAELFVAVRGERHSSLETTTDFSLWNDDEPFRPNPATRDGRLNALVIGASVDSLAYNEEPLETTYLRHQFESPFGRRLGHPTGKRDARSMWRIDWTSEISSPGLLAGDFDFRRHILSGRGRVIASGHQEVAARVIGGWSDGDLPPQRQFAIGGIGSVHGYGFKESTGPAMQLINVEYAVGWHDGLQLVAFVDAGHTGVARSSAQVRADAPWLKGAGWGIGLGVFRIDFGYKLAGSSHPVQVLVRLDRTF
jgi:hypothetical protein